MHAGRANSVFYTQLGSIIIYSRPMNLADNKRFAPSIYRNFGTGSSFGGNAFSDGTRGINLSGGTDPCSEGVGNLLIKRPSGWFYLPTISGPQKGWWVPPSSELEGPEQVYI